MSDEDLEAVVKAGTPICPTWTLVANIAEWGEAFGTPTALRDEFKRELEIGAKVIRRAWEAGVTLLIGTDSGFAATPYGEWHARELELFVRLIGMSPMDAIQAATRNGALTLRNGADVGTLEAGKLADVLVVDGDPLADIRILQDRRRLSMILQGGREVDLSRPWPERKVWAYERVMMLSGLMTPQTVAARAGGAGPR
jgi:imidazolonepropionase-like amidohydrolase